MDNPTTDQVNPITMLLKAITRMVAGPPMTDRGRFKQNVVEARIKNYESLVSVWFQPR